MATKRDPNALYCDEPTLTQQHFAAECDINEILRRSAISGVLPVTDKTPKYVDFTVVPKTLLEAMSVVKQANDLFAALPWQVRERFANDAEKMISFLNDGSNRDEAIKLGLVSAPVVPAVVGESGVKAASEAKSTKAKPVGE